MRTGHFTAALLLAAGATAGSLPAVAETTGFRVITDDRDDHDFRSEASTLLREVQATAADLTRDAAILHSYRLSDVSRDNHLIQANRVKEHTNAIGERLLRLRALRDLAEPWQQQAIDSVLPVAASLAAHTEGAIIHLNENVTPRWHPDYTARLQKIADRSDRLKAAVDLHLDITDTQRRLDQLSERLNALGS